MNILSIITSFTYGGAESLVSNLSGAFARHGHKSAVVALTSASSIGNCPLGEKAIRAKINGQGGRTGVLLSSHYSLLRGAWALRKLVAREKPDVVHAHTARALLMLWLAGVKKPVALTHHNSRMNFNPRLFRLFDRIANAYVAISDDSERIISACGGRPIVRINNASGPGFLTSAARSHPGEPVRLLAVGATTNQKNYAMMIEAAALLRKSWPESSSFSLEIAGSGPCMKDLARLIEARKVGDIVRLLGNRSDIADLLVNASIFLNSSHYEGLPIAIIEALQSGLPIVGTAVSGTRELVTDGENGLLVAPNDPQAMASAIHAVSQQPDRYARMSAAAIERGRNYTLEKCAAAHLDLYDQLVAQDADLADTIGAPIRA